MKRISAAAVTAFASAACVVGVGAPAHAAPVAHTASFTGGFTTTCDLAYSPDGGGRSGPYTCDHSATSIACTAVTSQSPATLCSATLVSGSTSGYAIGNEPATTAQWWYCNDGAGWGTFRYQPSPSHRTFEFTVSLTMNFFTRTIEIVGSEWDSDNGGFITVRATIPAHCTPHITAAEGFQGAVAPRA